MAVISGIQNFFAPGFRLFAGEDINAAISADRVSYADGLTAGPGGLVAGALQLSAVVNRVTVVATPGDGVKLPPALPGANVTVDNDAANYLTVFPAGSDQIEDSTAGQIQFAGQDTSYTCTITGRWFALGSLSMADTLTAVGNNQATALFLQNGYNNITIGGVGTGARLPAAVPGTIVTVFVSGTGNNLKIYGRGADTIDGTAGPTGVTLSDTKRCAYYCFTAGKWISAQLGVVSA